MRRRLAVALLAGSSTLFAQEVRKAIPVERSDYDNPAWIQHLPGASPTATPMPVATPIPIATPLPMTTPGPEPGFTPYRPSGRIEVAPSATPTPEPVETATPAPSPAPTPTPDEDGVIRLSPNNLGSPEANAARDLEAANAVYARKMYDYAVTEYEKFLVSHPSAKGRDQALFRLAESHRLLGNEFSARGGYERLLREFREGEFAGAGAFRLGEYLLGDRLYEAALAQFQLAEAQASSPEVKLSAAYQEAQCLGKLNRPAEAMAKYKSVSQVTKDNPYRNYARLKLAEMMAAGGQKKEALEEFSDLVKDPGPAMLRAEAAVKAGSLAGELGDAKKASSFFDQALALPDLGDWRPIALIGSLRANYGMGNYDKVTSLVEKNVDDLPEDARPEALLMAANSYRQQGNARAAKAVYDRLITKYPEAAQSQDARFQKLVSMYQLDDPKLIEEVDLYLQNNSDPKQRSRAILLKAETLFKNNQFAEASSLYAQILSSPLDEDTKGKALMKYGWCLMKTNQYQSAAGTFTEYLKKFPNGASAIPAIIQRGLAYQELKDYPNALKDFDLVIEKHPKAGERELALQQKALVLGQQQEYAGMTEVFKKLLEEYPKTAAASQANFWIGWAAYENKDYKSAITSLETARKLDPAQYSTRAGLRIVLCYYYLQDREGLKKAISEGKDIEVPTEVTRWLGRQSFEEGDYEGARRYLQMAVKDGKSTDPDALIELSEAMIQQGDAQEAAGYIATYMTTARDPISRARGIQAQARISLAAKRYAEARTQTEESLLLQPEGKLNAEGRLLLGEILMASGDPAEAAKAFLTVAVLYDDPEITPKALVKAAEAYRKAGNTFEAEKALQELQQRYPNFKKSPKSTKDNS